MVLDNFEHVLDAADVVGRLLATCPDVKVVATSRAPLHLRWEHEMPVAPLKLPTRNAPDAAAVLASAAGQLFVVRAQSVAPDFELGDADATAIAELCAQVDGLPLAIELAAARVKLLPPRALVRRLRQPPDADRRTGALELLADRRRDLPPRQQTLLRAITWSYDLLDEPEQAFLRRLSVFVGGCSVEAAVEIGAFDMAGGLDVLISLVDKSLLWREAQSDGEPRVRMLETIRQFASDQLALHDESDDLGARHVGFYVDLAERAARHFGGIDEQVWFDRLETDRANLRAAEIWAAAHAGSQSIVRLAPALWPF